MEATDGYAELAGLLAEAAAEIDTVEELNMFCPFDSPAEFSVCVRELGARVSRRDHVALRDLIPIFAPTGAWDDMGGSMNIANLIMGLLHLLKWNAER